MLVNLWLILKSLPQLFKMFDYLGELLKKYQVNEIDKSVLEKAGKWDELQRELNKPNKSLEDRIALARRLSMQHTERL